MVGPNTALIDNPKLTVRRVKGKSPMRIFIDKGLKIPSASYLLDGSVQTLVFTARQKQAKKNVEYVIIDFRKDVLEQILQELGNRYIQSLIVEGGAALLNLFLKQNLWDEARVFTNKKMLSEIAEKKVNGVEAPRMKMEPAHSMKMGSDDLKIYYN